MASPIKETPVLRGRDAERFLRKANNVVKVSLDERVKIEENYRKALALVK